MTILTSRQGGATATLLYLKSCRKAATFRRAWKLAVNVLVSHIEPGPEAGLMTQN
jgi:hypothetical protein